MTDKNTQHDTEVVTKTTTDVEEPSLYNVIFNNDDYTPMDFVIQMLMDLFHKSYDEAYSIMLKVHMENQGIAGCYPKEIASEKVNMVHDIATDHNFPLTCRIEKA